MKEEEFEKALESIPFPEELVNDMSIEQKKLFRKCWSGNLEKFVSNLEDELGIDVKVVDEKKGIVQATKRTSKG